MAKESEFIDLCEIGNLNETIEFYKQHINTPDNTIFSHAFITACINKNLNIAEWLLFTKHDVITAADCECVFYYACQNGDIDTVKWIFSLHRDIKKSIDYDFAFHNSCKNGHYDIARWLASQVKLTLFVND